MTNFGNQTEKSAINLHAELLILDILFNVRKTLL